MRRLLYLRNLLTCFLRSLLPSVCVHRVNLRLKVFDSFNRCSGTLLFVSSDSHLHICSSIFNVQRLAAVCVFPWGYDCVYMKCCVCVCQCVVCGSLLSAAICCFLRLKQSLCVDGGTYPKRSDDGRRFTVARRQIKTPG